MQKYTIHTATGWGLFCNMLEGGETFTGKTVKLGADITVSRMAGSGAAEDLTANDRPFCGHFDGNSKTISGIRIYKDGIGSTNSYQGLFGRTSPSAVIHDLTLADARITGYDLTGGIVGYNYGGTTITRCHVAGDVAVCAVQYNAYYHGGIVGQNHSGTVTGCTSAASITTDADKCVSFGGIVGGNNDTVEDCIYLGSTVEGKESVGAIAGK